VQSGETGLGVYYTGYTLVQERYDLTGVTRTDLEVRTG
jgi:hypothetical protein